MADEVARVEPGAIVPHTPSDSLPYRIVVPDPEHEGKRVDDPILDPYVERWGPSPYERARDSRREIAYDESRRNSLSAKREIESRGAEMRTFLLLLRCSHAEVEANDKRKDEMRVGDDCANQV